ncbi:MAG TPA: VWA domain-containing protein [Opitutaceae bacterium]|jgi:Ca-activated chloride channel family protein|nr:VWA domain-containing protein [Opitutaceae bacterium]
MSFYWPHVLWLLFAPAALLAWGLARRRGITQSLHPKILRAEADTRHLSLVTSAAKKPAHARPWLCVGLALAIVALARPQWGRLEEQVFDQSREILLALDLSRSMNSQDVRPTRLDRAKLLIQSLLDRLRGERVGLVVFSGTAFLQSPLSADYEILREFLPALNPDFLPEGGTNYRELLETSLDAFSASASADRYLIILSDGEATDENWRPLIDELKKKNIRVIGLGVGTTGGAMIPDSAGGFVKDERGAVVLSKLESSTLRELAEKTGGAYADASSWVDLPALLQATVEAGHRGQFHEENRVRLAERFQWALAPALLCLLISFWREFPVRPRARDMRLASAPPKKYAKAQALAATAPLLVLAMLCLPHSVRADDENTFAAPLTNLVSHLAAQETATAHNWADLAEATVTYGQRLQTAQRAVPAGPVRDAFAAVDAGEALDAKAANWPELRRQLAALQKKPEEKKQQQQQKQQQQNQSQQSQSQKNDSDQSQQNSPQNQSGQGQQKDQQQKSSEQKNSSGQNSKSSDKNQNSQDKNQSQLGQSAFGDMKEPAQKPASAQPQTADARELQKFGGTPRQKSSDAATDPALAVPLEKLDQLKQQDSPAALYELMRGEAKPAPSNGKNW